MIDELGIVVFVGLTVDIFGKEVRIIGGFGAGVIFGVTVGRITGGFGGCGGIVCVCGRLRR
jgi:hypothetical protein